MKIAVINSGSSSLKFKLFDMTSGEVLESILIENIGDESSKIKNHYEALQTINIDFSSLDAIGHRVVHGGEDFHMPTIVDEKILEKIRLLIPLAPLHNPANIKGIEVAKLYAPKVPQIAVFDTGFHFHMPRVAYTYALPYEMYEKHKIRRYGFHGTSHSFVAKETAKILNKELSSLNLITLHLGNGASACAIQKGVSIDTSMGFTPLEGLVMGTRSGDIDPAIIIYMQRELGLSVDEVDKLLNKESGLFGISGLNDVRSLVNSDNEKAKLALDIMIRRVKKYIGAYMALLGHVDYIVFTGGIGENSQYIRDEILDSILFEGIKTLVIKTNEELEIANECLRVIKL
jgi:acetate kinase